MPTWRADHARRVADNQSAVIGAQPIDFTRLHRKFAFNTLQSPDAGRTIQYLDLAGLFSATHRNASNRSMPPVESFPSVRFAITDLPERDRIALWREHYGHTIFRAEVEPVCDASFRATVISRALPDLHLRYGALSAIRITRSREFLTDGNDDFALVINRAGRVAAIARDREVVLESGDAVLVNSAEVTTFDRSTRGGSLSMRIPHAVLAARLAGVDDVVMRRIPRAADALALLTSYVMPLLKDTELTTPELRRLAVAHAQDLVALTLGAARDAAEDARNRGVRAAHLSKAKAYIVEHSGDPSLAIGTVARQVGVTLRYVQKLFEGDGSTFSAFLLGQRLARAHRALTSPQYDSRQISAIAYAVGFGDLSYFNRCFRQRYGGTPRDIRNAGRTESAARAASPGRPAGNF